MHPRKRFGQNFLQDQNIIRKIVAAINPKSKDHIVEIGPGLGALTKQVLPLAQKMDAIELDKDLIPELEQNCKSLGELNIHQADALSFDFSSLITNNHKIRVIGNLPYNISTPLLFHLLDYIDQIEDMHFMLQKEVVDRLAAPPNTKTYGRLSIMLQYACNVEALFKVPPTAFYPIPKVDSAIVRLIPKTKKNIVAKNLDHLEKIVKLAFGQRRKTIQNSLKPLITTEQLQAINIDPQLRAENLTVDEFVNISNLL